MLEANFLKDVQGHVFNLLKKELPPYIVYHNFLHTQSVVDAVQEIAKAERVSDSDLELLTLAAWFHDTGFTTCNEGHEDCSISIAKDYLTKKEISPLVIDKVAALINVTKTPQQPTNKLEGIMCDADLFHLGATDFKERAALLRTEWEASGHKTFTDIEWLKSNEAFILNHQYFTDYAYRKFHDQKTKNWLKTQKDLRKALAEEEELKFKIKSKKDALNRKKEKNSRPERGIETMYRVTLRNHIKLSDIADTKANILLSVSAIVLSIALSNLFPKLDKPDNDYLIYPTLFFLIITVVTMIFSILSTRPKVTSGKFTKEDVANKKVNLLFFGNFHKMSLQDFQDGMTEVMNDRDYLYKSLMKDLYFLGLVLEKKYKLLRVAYTIFMIGIILSVCAFIVAFEIMKHGMVL